MALPGVRRELAGLPAVAPLLPAAVPVPELVGTDDDADDPWPLTGARLIAGVELADGALPDAGRTRLAAVRAEEARYGLDAWGRCAMVRDVRR